MKKKTAEAARDLIFEIGTEELPATNLADLFEPAAGTPKADLALLAKWKKIFQDYRIPFESAEVWATPRRLVFYLKNVSAAQEPCDRLTKLMAHAEAYGPSGQPTEKLLTVLKHRNTPLEETLVSELNGKPHVFIKKAEPVRKTVAVLPELLEAFVPTLPFPKTMKWDDSGFYFPRPIRSTLCFYGTQCIRYLLADVRSGDKSFIFSKSKRTGYPVADGVSYFKLLNRHGVILDPVERKKSIQFILDKLARSFHGRLYEDPFLMNEVNFLVENPQGLSAGFDEQFLKLPVEVLAVSMARQQRLFGLTDPSGKLLPKFLAVVDRPMNEKERKLISRNCENILQAKLRDSLFFYREDSKVSLEKRRAELKNIIFLKGAGSIYEKTERLVNLSKQFSQELKLSKQDQDTLERACFLSKCDLLTQMVGEFPELQGVMGKYYALESGEPASVSSAIGEQYLPRTLGDRLPDTLPGCFLSIFDKCDLVCACFGLGLEPTSSMDPYALRRSATSVLRIILDKKLELSLSRLLVQSDRFTHDVIDNHHPKKNLNHDQREKKLRLFFRDRLTALFIEKGFDTFLIEAVLDSGFDSPYEVLTRLESLSKISAQRYFMNACKVVERTHNILKGYKDALPDTPDSTLFVEPLEEQVLKQLESNKPGICDAKKERDFARATSLYAEAFFDILSEFFDKVFINAEDPKVRKNRLSLLKNVKELYTRDIADLSNIQAHLSVTEPAN